MKYFKNQGTADVMECNFPEIISNLRKTHGIAQKTAASDLGVSQALLSHYEKGIRECGLDFLIKLSKYYNVSCDYLLGKQKDLTEPDDKIKLQAHVLNNVLEYAERFAPEETFGKLSAAASLMVYRLLRNASEASGGYNNVNYAVDYKVFSALGDSLIGLYTAEMFSGPKSTKKIKQLNFDEIEKIVELKNDAEKLIKLHI